MLTCKHFAIFLLSYIQQRCEACLLSNISSQKLPAIAATVAKPAINDSLPHPDLIATYVAIAPIIDKVIVNIFYNSSILPSQGAPKVLL